MNAEQLIDTRSAFDSVADAYDGPLGNNALVQAVRDNLVKAAPPNIGSSLHEFFENITHKVSGEPAPAASMSASSRGSSEPQTEDTNQRESASCGLSTS